MFQKTSAVKVQNCTQASVKLDQQTLPSATKIWGKDNRQIFEALMRMSSGGSPVHLHRNHSSGNTIVKCLAGKIVLECVPECSL